MEKNNAGLISHGLIFRNAKEISTHSWHSLSLKSKAKECSISCSISLLRDYCPYKLNLPWPSHQGSGHWCSLCSNSPWAAAGAHQSMRCDCWPPHCPCVGYPRRGCQCLWLGHIWAGHQHIKNLSALGTALHRGIWSLMSHKDLCKLNWELQLLHADTLIMPLCAKQEESLLRNVPCREYQPFVQSNQPWASSLASTAGGRCGHFTNLCLFQSLCHSCSSADFHHPSWIKGLYEQK